MPWQNDLANGRGSMPMAVASSQTGKYSSLCRKVDNLGRYHRRENISNRV